MDRTRALVTKAIGAMLGCGGWFLWLPKQVGQQVTDLSMLIVPLVLVGTVALVRAQHAVDDEPSQHTVASRRPLIRAGLLAITLLFGSYFLAKGWSSRYYTERVWVGWKLSAVGSALKAENPTLSTQRFVEKSAGDVFNLWEPWSIWAPELIVLAMYASGIGFGLYTLDRASYVLASRTRTGVPHGG